MKKIQNSLLILILLASCSSPSDQPGVHVPEGLSRQEMTRYKQYLIQGQKLYRTHCENCHQKDGKGLGTLYPPLAESDFLGKNRSVLSCIVRFGINGEITVNNIQYNMEMQGVADLKPLQIAEILTFVGNKWGNQEGMISVQEVQAQLSDCKNSTD